tara:strand:- start:453 stop:1262 length:810 start_codon:yes stop_codon:yes gene_type:complete
MPKPASREGLKDYALRRLGSPVIDINVDDEQLEERMDDALQFFADYHYDGTQREIVSVQVTEQNQQDGCIDLKVGVTESTSYPDLKEKAAIDPNGDSVISVVRVFQFSEGSINLFDIRYQMALNDYFGIRNPSTGISNYNITRNHLTMIQDMLSPEKALRFSRVTNKVHIDMNWEEQTDVGDYLVLELYRILNADTYPEIYDDRLLKKYYTALVKQQWGTNLSKFDGIQMPGGITFNGQQLYDSATEEIRTIEEEMQLKYETPPNFFVG